MKSRTGWPSCHAAIISTCAIDRRSSNVRGCSRKTRGPRRSATLSLAASARMKGSVAGGRREGFITAAAMPARI
jgi:hypothetical protein